MLGFNAISEVAIAQLPGAFVPLSGVNGTSAVGSVTTIGKAIVTLVGVEGTTGTPEINVWGLIDDSQDPSWANVSDTQNPNWEEVA